MVGSGLAARRRGVRGEQLPSLLKEGSRLVSRGAGLMPGIQETGPAGRTRFPAEGSSVTKRKNDEPVSLAKLREDRDRTESDLEAELTIAAWAPGRRRYERFKALLAERAARRSA